MQRWTYPTICRVGPPLHVVQVELPEGVLEHAHLNVPRCKGKLTSTVQALCWNLHISMSLTVHSLEHSRVVLPVLRAAMDLPYKL